MNSYCKHTSTILIVIIIVSIIVIIIIDVRSVGLLWLLLRLRRLRCLQQQRPILLLGQLGDDAILERRLLAHGVQHEQVHGGGVLCVLCDSSERRNRINCAAAARNWKPRVHEVINKV